MSDVAEVRYKVVLIGDSKVGKTALAKRLLSDEFVSEYGPTTGCEVSRLPLETTEGRIVLEIWDVGGHDAGSPLKDGFFIGADAALAVFDCTSKDTFARIEPWVRHLRAVLSGGREVPIVAIANKIDSAGRVVSAVTHIRGLPCYEVSVKESTGLLTAIHPLSRALTKHDDLTITAVNGRPVKEEAQQPPDELSL
ncbi:GTP-binding protein [Streptomyces fungicidicus]|uniref:GTP-binding protein n=1 Tax=Streptomyces fungicidicus TaxID=68203 RepID=UPI0013CE61B2|nr:GTP-binding protein [Streptomyces fungicidicus]